VYDTPEEYDHGDERQRLLLRGSRHGVNMPTAGRGAASSGCEPFPSRPNR
jgi:hypothetical protein